MRGVGLPIMIGETPTGILKRNILLCSIGSLLTPCQMRAGSITRQGCSCAQFGSKKPQNPGEKGPQRRKGSGNNTDCELCKVPDEERVVDILIRIINAILRYLVCFDNRGCASEPSQ